MDRENVERLCGVTNLLTKCVIRTCDYHRICVSVVNRFEEQSNVILSPGL